MLGSISTHAANKNTQIHPDKLCQLQASITIQNKAQKKNVRRRTLAKGVSVEIVRHHKVWTRIRVNGKIAFAKRKVIQKLCTAKKAQASKPEASPTPISPPAPEPATSLPAKDETSPGAGQSPAPLAPIPDKLQEAEEKPIPTSKATPPSKVQLPEAKVPQLNPVELQTSTTYIPTGAWVAMGAGVLSIGASTYCVTALTPENEASTGQLALVAGTAGIMAVVVGLSYILVPQKVVSEPISGSSTASKAQILVGPSSIGIAGTF